MSERDEALRRWRAGEERLYPVVMVRPDLYERCIGLVRALADALANVPDLDALVATYRTGDARRDLARAGVDPVDLPPEVDRDLVRDAAYQHRARELAARVSAERAERLIRRARAAGVATVVLWSEGERELVPPYRRVEMSVATGRAVMTATETDPERLEPLFVLEGLQLDPETGAAAGEEPLVPRREYRDPEAWRTDADALRADLLTP